VTLRLSHPSPDNADRGRQPSGGHLASHGKHPAGRDGRKSRSNYRTKTPTEIRRSETWNDARY
jgi:hypothetical protein